jgi:signal peptidase I
MENNNQEINENAETCESGNKTETKKGKPLDDFLELVESTLATVFVIFLLFTYFLHPVSVVGGSMNPTLSDGDKVFMNLVYTKINRGDIVVIDNNSAFLIDDTTGEVYPSDSAPLDECIIKRVIGCGGDVIDIDFTTGKVILNGEELDESYTAELIMTNDGAMNFPITVPEGYYFVLGDNRNHSSDSRNRYVGLIKEEQIYGKAFFRYSPLSDMELL